MEIGKRLLAGICAVSVAAIQITNLLTAQIDGAALSLAIGSITALGGIAGGYYYAKRRE